MFGTFGESASSSCTLKNNLFLQESIVGELEVLSFWVFFRDRLYPFLTGGRERVFEAQIRTFLRPIHGQIIKTLSFTKKSPFAVSVSLANSAGKSRSPPFPFFLPRGQNCFWHCERRRRRRGEGEKGAIIALYTRHFPSRKRAGKQREQPAAKQSHIFLSNTALIFLFYKLYSLPLKIFLKLTFFPL